MKETTPRRSFLLNSLKAGTGMALLSSTTVFSAFPLKETGPFAGYNPFAETKTDLRIHPLGNYVEIKGRILDKAGKNPLADAMIEVWHLSPNSDKYRHRAKFHTDANGEYQFLTDTPGREYGKYHKIYFKISQKQRFCFTEISFNRWSAHISDKHWEANQGLDPELLFPTCETILNTQKIQFNITL